MTAASQRPRIRCVGAVLRDDTGRLLLVRRGQAPAAGTWSLPGGRVEPGESDAEALMREVREETGLRVRVGDLVGTVERDGPAGVMFEIRDYACTPVGGGLVAGSDAADARWVAPGELGALPCSPGLVDALTEWGVIGGGAK
ncbi:MAG: NUDIX domain-containing protein [Actinomycetota bacterium]|nr:NUDIX domain-containing protein [Actinomycetota bacterium]